MVDIILKKRITVKTIIVRADISFPKPSNFSQNILFFPTIFFHML